LIENSIDSLKLIIKEIEIKNWSLCYKRYQKDLERFRKNLEHRNYIFTQKHRKYLNYIWKKRYLEIDFGKLKKLWIENQISNKNSYAKFCS
jgi:hypothetical protein